MNTFNNVNIQQVNQFSTQDNGIKDVIDFTARGNSELPVYYTEKFNIKLSYTLILLAKNQKNILSKAIHDKVKFIITNTLSDWNITLENYQESQNNCQITFSIDPNLNLHFLITEFKQYSSDIILSTFSKSLAPFKLNQSIWEDGYFLRTVGENITADIKHFTLPKKEAHYALK